MAKRILVTGGAGFLGHHLVEHILKKTDFDVTVLDNLTYSSNGFDRLRDIGCFDSHRVHRYVHNIAEPMTVGLKREMGEFDYIAHVAAETHVDNSISSPEPFVVSNVIGTFRMLELAREQDHLEKFVYFSTDEVFGPASLDAMDLGDDGYKLKRRHNYREWDRYNSTNPYSATKAAGEELCLAWGNTYGVPVVVTHCMNLFGERQHVEKFIPGSIRRILAGDTLVIHADPSRQRAGSRFYLHARNAADAVLYLLDHGERREKYNISGQREYDNLALVDFIAGMLGKPYAYEMVDFHSSRPGHDLRYALDGSKMEELGWKAPVEFEESLERTIKWFLTNRKWLNLDE